MNRILIRIIVMVLIAIFALSALAPAFGSVEATGDRIVETVDGDPDKGEALVTREYIRLLSPSGTRLVVEDIVYVDGNRLRREYRDDDGTLKLEEHFYKQQLVGGRINWRLSHRFVYADDGYTIVDRQYFDADGSRRLVQ